MIRSSPSNELATLELNSVLNLGQKELCKTLELLNMPTEIIHLVLEYLTYPDALALKCTHPRFKRIVEPTMTVARRVEWLIERSDMGLTVPRWRQLNLRNDRGFTANPEVRAMLRKRRKHEDCYNLAHRVGQFAVDDEGNIDDGTESYKPHRCTINPNERRCVGIQKATRVDAWDVDPVYHNVTYIDRHHWLQMPDRVNGTNIMRFLTVLIGQIIAVVAIIGASIVSLNRLRLKIMFKVWMLVEMMILGAVVANVFMGVGYRDILDNLVILARHADTVVSRSGWSIFDC